MKVATFIKRNVGLPLYQPYRTKNFKKKSFTELKHIVGKDQEEVKDWTLIMFTNKNVNTN